VHDGDMELQLQHPLYTFRAALTDSHVIHLLCAVSTGFKQYFCLISFPLFYNSFVKTNDCSFDYT